jgi:uncharacterized protein (DUF305 family)
MLRSTRQRRAAPRHASAQFVSALLALAVLALPSTRLAAQAPHDYTAADAAFVQMMIIHHAQAVVMSDMAPTHGASPALQTLAKRIALSQRDEIELMQHWLEERHLPVPDPLHMLSDSARAASDSAEHAMAGMSMPGMSMPRMTAPNDTTPVMHGMLTPAQMRALAAAHGAEFDRLYLTGMIMHHQGAIDMVAALFSTPGSGQQPDLFGFATDVDAGQRVEIARMQALLNSESNTLTPSPH